MRFEIYEDKTGEHRFRLVAHNGEIVAQSEGYTRRNDCLDTVRSIIVNGLDPDIEIIEPETQEPNTPE